MIHSVRGRGFELIVALITASDPKITPYTFITGRGCGRTKIYEIKFLLNSVQQISFKHFLHLT